VYGEDRLFKDEEKTLDEEELTYHEEELQDLPLRLPNLFDLGLINVLANQGESQVFVYSLLSYEDDQVRHYDRRVRNVELKLLLVSILFYLVCLT